jgi:hypothetical protein
MRVPGPSWRLVTSAAVLATGVYAGTASGAPAAPTHRAPSNAATPDVPCDRGSMPEKEQGRAPAADYTSGRAAKGYFCNARQIAHFGSTAGGYRVERYVDHAGHVCGYYDSTLLFPTDVSNQGTEGPGTYVLDMTSVQRPVLTDTLKTPAMMSPHESLRLNQKRGLLVADMGYPTFQPGFVDVYDVSQDCRHPVLDASLPIGILGHESGFAPDGKTFYVANPGGSMAAIDLTDPKFPGVLWTSFDYKPHGVSISNDGNTLFMADLGSSHGLTILDVSQIQHRVANPQVKVLAHLVWPTVSIPQNATPFVEGKHHFLIEADEFGGGTAPVGAARIINIDDLKHPYVASNLRLEVNNHPAETSDPGDGGVLQGYQAHYCSTPSRINPTIVACSFIMSGLRVFDIRNPYHPREVAYFNKPLMPAGNPFKEGSFAMSAPAYDPARNDIWYTDGETGFWVVHLTKGSGITRFAQKYYLPGN